MKGAEGVAAIAARKPVSLCLRVQSINPLSCLGSSKNTNLMKRREKKSHLEIPDGSNSLDK